MPRKRTELGASTEARIVALMRTGGTAESIAAQLAADGVTVSRATIGRRMKELAGRVAEERKAARERGAESLPLPATPEDIPADASLSQLDTWIAMAHDGAIAAQDEADLGLMATLLRTGQALAETRRKATPPERADPNDSPDMIAMAKETRERLHKMVELVAKGVV